MPGKYKRGVGIIKSYIRKHPEDWYMLSQLGIAYSRQGDDVEAEACLKKALNINPHCPHTNYELGTLLNKQGKVEAAIHYYQMATASNSLLAEAHAELGCIWLEKGMYDHAIPELQKALTINPDMAEVCNNSRSQSRKSSHELRHGLYKTAQTR
jgi:tetratricopeptide (TPR) repeat protein